MSDIDPAICTECGADTYTGGCYVGYTVRNAVWNKAFPHYKAGIGVGATRPCVPCLEKRLGRTLTADDFVLPPCTRTGATS